MKLLNNSKLSYIGALIYQFYKTGFALPSDINQIKQDNLNLIDQNNKLKLEIVGLKSLKQSCQNSMQQETQKYQLLQDAYNLKFNEVDICNISKDYESQIKLKNEEMYQNVKENYSALELKYEKSETELDQVTDELTDCKIEKNSLQMQNQILAGGPSVNILGHKGSAIRSKTRNLSTSEGPDNNSTSTLDTCNQDKIVFNTMKVCFLVKTDTDNTSNNIEAVNHIFLFQYKLNNSYSDAIKVKAVNVEDTKFCDTIEGLVFYDNMLPYVEEVDIKKLSSESTTWRIKLTTEVSFEIPYKSEWNNRYIHAQRWHYDSSNAYKGYYFNIGYEDDIYEVRYEYV